MKKGKESILGVREKRKKSDKGCGQPSLHSRDLNLLKLRKRTQVAAQETVVKGKGIDCWKSIAHQAWILHELIQIRSEGSVHLAKTQSEHCFCGFFNLHVIADSQFFI